MRRRFRWLPPIIVLPLALLLWSPFFTLAQEESDTPPAEIQLVVDRSTLNQGESTQAILILRNTTAYTLTDMAVQFQSVAFKVVNPTPLPNTLSPYTSALAEYTLQSQTAGSQNLIFAVQYSWDELATGLTHRRLETVSVEKIEVTSPFGFNWPDYLIPLVIGALFSQFITWFTDWQKQRQESRQREEQARGVVLAVLQTTRKGVEAREQVSFSLWEEAIVKGNLYPALHQLGRKIGKPELSKRLAELSIALADYNDRQAKNNLTEKLVADLVNELTDLIKVIESRG